MYLTTTILRLTSFLFRFKCCRKCSILNLCRGYLDTLKASSLSLEVAHYKANHQFADILQKPYLKQGLKI